MQWSKLKARAESRFCDSLRGRLELHSTCYRGTHDGEGRAWLTFDKQELFSACTLIWRRREAMLARELQLAAGCTDYTDPAQLPGYRAAYQAANERLSRVGIHGQYQFYGALKEVLDLSIEDALVSTNDLVRAFALVDRRLGKRRLARLSIGDGDHPLVRRLYEIRMAVEGPITPGERSPVVDPDDVPAGSP
jgi:hypothetical protein